MTYEELHKLTLEGVFEATVLAEDGLVVDCNEAFLLLLGASREQIIGASVLAFAPPESRPRIQAALESGEPEAYTIDGQRLDGGQLHVEVLGRSFEVEGRAIRVSSIRNLTEGEKVRTALRESESRYRSLFENAADGIMVMDRQGRPQEVNQRLCRILGFTAAEILNMPTEQGIADLSDNPMQLSRLDRESAYVVERSLRKSDGSELPVEVNLTALDDELVLAVIRDITDRRQAEVEERALRQQLNQAQKLESVGRLAGGIAHDFNNLLTIILANAELIGAGQSTPERQIEEILRATQRATDLTSQLLLFSRRNVQHPQILDPNEAVREAEKMIHRLLGEDVEIELDLAPEVGRIVADPGQLSQVLLNLAINARDAMPSGGRLTFRTRQRVSADENGAPLSHLLLEVADTGEGIAPEIREFLFEPFFSTKAPERGTGLGLSTVYGIVTGAGGTIELDSTPGKGTSFLIVWPNQDVMAAATTTPPPAKRLARQETTYRVVVVEDESAVARIIQRTLEIAGHEVVAVGEAMEVIELLEKTQLDFDLLLTDVVMPGISGPEVAQRLGAEKVLFISGYPDAALGDRQIETDQARLLTKPFTSAVLLEAVDNAVKGLPVKSD